jgi:two-component system phosphate regulon sensor histidine kinase PhoR
MRREAEARMQKISTLKKEFEDIVEIAPSGIFTVDTEGKITYWNKAAEEIWGYKKEEVIGKSCIFEETPQCRGMCTIFDLKNGTLKGDYEVVTKNGEKKTVAKRATLLKDEDGNVIGAVESFIDITDKKKAEERLKEKANELENAGRLKDLFIDILRHDLLNSIGVIKNVSELMKSDPSFDSANGIEMINRNAIRLEDMVKEASVYAELRTVKELSFEERDLTPFIASAVENLSTTAKKKKITIDNRVKGKHILPLNPFIESVFSNLISNAIKYSPNNSEVIIDIEDKGDSVKVVVKDRGEGIKDEYKEKIFHRFRIGKKEGIKGSGIGLAIVRRIVDLHNGKVWVEDNPGGGSIFFVEIPKWAR